MQFVNTLMPRCNMNKVVSLILKKDERAISVASHVLAAAALSTQAGQFVDAIAEIAHNIVLDNDAIDEINELINIFNECSPFTNYSVTASTYGADSISKDKLAEQITNLAQLRTTIDKHGTVQQKELASNLAKELPNNTTVYATHCGTIVAASNYSAPFMASHNPIAFNELVNHATTTLLEMVEATAEWRDTANEMEIIQTVIDVLLELGNRYKDVIQATVSSMCIRSFELVHFTFVKSETFKGSTYIPASYVSATEIKEAQIVVYFGRSTAAHYHAGPGAVGAKLQNN